MNEFEFDTVEFESEKIEASDKIDRITKAMFLACAVKCKKMLYNYLYQQEKVGAFEVDLTIETALKQLEDMSKKYFGISKTHYVEFAPLSTMIVDTKNAIVDAKKRRPYINGATFKSPDGCICRTHWMEVTPEKEIILYSIHINTSSSEDKKILNQIYNLAYQHYVIENAGYKVAKEIVMIIDRDYRKPKYGQNPKRLFSQVDVTEFVNSVITGKALTDDNDNIVFDERAVKDIMNDVKEIASYRNKSADDLKALCPKCITSDKCHKPNDCECLETCMEDMGAKDSIVWKLIGAKKEKKHNLANAGFVTPELLLMGVNAGAVKLNAKQVRQLEFATKPNLPHHIENDNILDWWGKTYGNATKLYFLDFETFQFAIPKWQNLAPYAKVPVQFSLHIWDRVTCELTHHEFLVHKGEDPRRRCAEKLCELIPEDGIGVAYNAGFEKSVCGELAEIFPDLSDHLLAIAANMTDIMKPFQSHWYYRGEFDGRYSIKFVLPGLFPNDATLDYHNLEEVQNGTMAMDAYLRISNMSGKEAVKTRKNMLAYCALDTFAMVKIFWYLELLVQTGFNEKKTIRDMKKLYSEFSAQGEKATTIRVIPADKRKVV